MVNTAIYTYSAILNYSVSAILFLSLQHYTFISPFAPNLRFPGFTDEWVTYSFEDIATFFSGGTPASSEKSFYGGDIPFIRSGEIHSDSTGLFLTKDGVDASSAKMVDEGDLLIALYGATSGDISICKIKGAINQAVLCVRTAQNKIFLKGAWEKHSTFVLRTYLQGGQGNLSADIVKKLQFSLPSPKEQDKIACLLSLVETRITTQSEAIDKLQLLIKATYQYVQRGGKSNGTWKDTKLSEVLTERKEYNTENHPVYSVSVSTGVVNQIEHLGRSFSAKDTTNYNVVRHGDVVYTKSPTGDFPYGIVKRSCVSCAVAVSPLYGVYRPIYNEMGILIHYYFLSPINTHNYLHPLIQKGAKNTINISDSHFLDNAIPLPTRKEDAMRVAKVITRIQNKLDLEKELLEKLKTQKQCLLQQMFI